MQSSADPPADATSSSDLERDYCAAWDEWAMSADRELWEPATGDGMFDRSR